MLIVVSLLALFGAACGQAPVDLGQVPTPTATPTPTAGCVTEYLYESINALANKSEAAIIGRVISMTEPQTNAAPEETPGALPLHRFRDTDIRADQVLWSSSSLSVASGQTVAVRLADGGSHSGCEVGGKELLEDEISGPVERETDVLFMLIRGTFNRKDGQSPREEQVVYLTRGFLTNWTVRDGIAVSVVAERSVPLQELIDKLLLERARGVLKTDPGYQQNPLKN